MSKETISRPDERRLHTKSGNKCARCKEILVENDVCIGENAHIYGEKPGAARYDASKPAAYVNSEQNLIFLCRNCHKIIDQDVARYTTEVLFSMKKEHEADVRAEKQVATFFTNLPERNNQFSGREKELAEVREAFENSGAVCVKQSIAGLGGVGKTQLALEYAHRFKGEYADAIWWVNAENSPKAGLVGLARTCGLVSDTMDKSGQLKEDDILGMLYDWFGIHNSFLLIFDNVDSAEDIKEIVSHISTGHLLVTTRDRKLKLNNTTSVDLDIFSLKDARKFMRERLSREFVGSEETMVMLIERLGRLPLALEQAAAYIADTDNNCSCESYLEMLEKHGLDMFEDEAAIPKNYDKIVTTTWKISFDRLSVTARQLFFLCAYMAPDNIPLDFFVRNKELLPLPLGGELSSEKLINKTIRNLTKYALVKRRGNFLYVHRLVQDVIQQNLEGETRWISICLNMARVAFKYDYADKQSREDFTQIAPQILKIAQHAEAILKNDDEAKEKTAWLYHEVGRGFDYSGEYDKALVWFEKARDIYEKALGKEHPDTAATYNNIAVVYDNQGDYNAALEWYMKGLAICEKALGKEHPSTAATYNNIAGVHNSQGDYGAALEWYMKALAIDEKVLGKEHPDTAMTYNNIAVVYKNQGDYNAALAWHKKALAIREKVLGKEHPDTAVTYNNLALVYNNQGDFGTALEWYMKALAIREKVLGEEHPDTAVTYNNLALVYKNQGDFGTALEWYMKALAIREKVLGKEHPDTAMTYNNIAVVHYSQGDIDTALVWYIKGYPIMLQRLGEKHPDTIAVRNNMESAYNNTGMDEPFEQWLHRQLGRGNA